MKRLLTMFFISYSLVGCGSGLENQESITFTRAKEIVTLFLKKDAQYTLTKSQEYKNSSGGTTVKGTCSISGNSYAWTLAFDDSGKVSSFNFDSVTFLAKQSGGHLSFLPENKKYVKNDVVAVPNILELEKAGINAKEGF
jgi:hypothetical protein